MRHFLLKLLVVASFSQSANSGELQVEVAGLKSDVGQVVLTLHDNADSFPTKPEQAIKTLKSKILGSQARVKFQDVLNGTYAIAVYHDENSNNELDSNFLGIPKEGVGVSNNAKGKFGPPKFEDAKFTFSNEKQLRINLNY
jgi:uncharacterized protein (DUF2141 family)